MTEAALRVSEIFESVQGEGASVGTPAVFLRLSGCNLRCSWCDTAYTWDWQRYAHDAEVHEAPVAELAARLRAAAPRTLVITGGEPLLQQPALADLLARLGPRLAVEVETAGTRAPAVALVGRVGRFNVSPKLRSSGNPEPLRRCPAALRAFAALAHAHFKFVVEGAADLPEVLALLDDLAVPRARAWLMPQAATRDELRARSPAVAALCRAHGLRFGPRLHVALFDGRRGI